MKCENGTIDGAHPCTQQASYQYTWPGQKRSSLCAFHMTKLCKSAIAEMLDITPIGNAPAFTPSGATDVVRVAVRLAEPSEHPAPPAPAPSHDDDSRESHNPIRR